MKTSKALIIASLIILAGIIFYSLSNRYYIDTSTQLIVDRLTGKVTRPTVVDNKSTEVEIFSSDQETINDYKTKSEGILQKARREDYIKKLDLLKGSENMMNKFRRYYDECIQNIKKDPLYYEGKKYTSFDFEEFVKYGSLLSPSNIAIAYIDESISDPDKYIKYLLSIIDQ